jgi:hypothetical protein
VNALSRWPALFLLVGFAVGACGGGEEAATPGVPASEPPPPVATQPAEETAQAGEPAQTAPAPGPAATTEATPQETGAEQSGEELVRETFSYRSSGRDPFLPLSSMENVRPYVDDLRVTGITFDTRYPGNSVAVVRDTSTACVAGCRYTLRVGDEVGQVRVVEITATEVIVVREQFGREQQIVLQLRRQQGGTP